MSWEHRRLHEGLRALVSPFWGIGWRTVKGFRNKLSLVRVVQGASLALALSGLTLIGRSAAEHSGELVELVAVQRANAAELAALGGVWLAGGSQTPDDVRNVQATPDTTPATQPTPPRVTAKTEAESRAIGGGPTSVAHPTSQQGSASDDSAAPSTAGLTSDGKVILNTADSQTFTRLPRVGPKRAQSIVQLRERLGRFRRITDLLRVKGIGPKTLRKLMPHVVLDPPSDANPPVSSTRPPGATAQAGEPHADG